MLSRLIRLMLLALLLLPACQPASPTATLTASPSLPPTQAERSEPYMFEKTECAYGDLPVKAECGSLIVPKDHNNPQSGPLRIAVTVLKATGASPKPDPVLFLAGGPGDSATQDVRSWLDHPLLKDHDLILVDQRGAGSSQPSLDCPELDSGDYTTDIEAARACHIRLVNDGVNLNLYNSAQSAADLNLLRQALGYDEWNVFGVSYGTRLALTLLRDYPQGIRSLVLDSAYPLEVDAYEDQPVSGARAVQLVFRACARDKDCAYIYPDLRMVYDQLLSRLDSKPLTLNLKNPRTGISEQMVLDGYKLSSLVFEALYNQEKMQRIPYVIYEINYGNTDAIADLVYGPPSLNDQPTPATVQVSDAGNNPQSAGLYYSVECQEEVPFNDPTAAKAKAEAADSPVASYLYEDVNALLEICNSWGVKRAPDIENKAVKSDLPAIVLSGQFDPTTPPGWARIASRDLSNSLLVTFPASGHAVMNSGACARQVITDFINNPAQKPDTSCTRQMELHFYVPR